MGFCGVCGDTKISFSIRNDVLDVGYDRRNLRSRSNMGTRKADDAFDSNLSSFLWIDPPSLVYR